MKYKLTVWRKEYNIKNINYFDYQYTLPTWESLYNNLSTKEILYKYFIKDIDDKEMVFSMNCKEVHDYNCKKLIFKVSRKDKKKFLLAIAKFKATLSKYFYFKG